MRTIRLDRVEFDGTKKIRESEEAVVLPAILTRESILPFPDGNGYRPANELKDAAWTLEGAWVVSLNHIETVFVTNRSDIRGKVENAKFSSDTNSITGDIRFFKGQCDEALLRDVKNGKLKDVSVAYFCEDVFTPGKFGGEPYDFLQQNFMFGHVAAGVPEGRCPSPFCGMNVDALLRPHRDPEETEKVVHIRVRDPDLFVDGSFRTITISEDQGIKAVVGKLKSDPKGSTVVQKFIFDKSKGWTMEKAEAWVKEHKDRADAEWTTAYMNDLPDSAFAFIEKGGEKDDEGKTLPRSLRHLPFRNAEGEIDHDHLLNALASMKQEGTMPEGGKKTAIQKLCVAVRSWNRDHPDSKIESDVCGTKAEADSRMKLDAEVEVERARALLSR